MDGKWNRVAVASIVESLKHRSGALLPILIQIQKELGYIPAESVPLVASGLNLSRAEVHGVIAFYHDFSFEPRGRNVVRICRAESCQSMGAVRLVERARQRLGIDFGETTPDGAFTLEAVYCLGNCACSPAATVNGSLYGRLSAEHFDRLLAEISERRH